MLQLAGAAACRRDRPPPPLVGMALLAAGIVVFRFALPGNVPLALLGSALTGLALGATVAPALFVAGFSLQSASLQRVFAIMSCCGQWRRSWWRRSSRTWRMHCRVI
jgi:hypothetical protein